MATLIRTSLLILCVAALSMSQTTSLCDGCIYGYRTVQSFHREMTEPDQAMYLMGVVDGMLAAPLFGAPSANTENLQACIRQMNTIQLGAIINKAAREQPEEWNLPLSAFTYDTLKKVCNF